MSGRRRTGLGQGLGALIPSSNTPPPRTSADANGETGLREIPIDSILPNPYQPRTDWDKEKLKELSDSVREYGVLQPLIVTQLDEGAIGERFRLIAGERRWRAAKQAGLKTVPVVVREATERDILEWALIENIQRADLNSLEEAAAYQQMSEVGGLTHEEVADRVGKSRSAVTNTMRLLQLPEPIQNMLRRGELTEGHARNLLGLKQASLMIETAQRVINDGLNVRQTEELVNRIKQGVTERNHKENRLSVQDRDLERQFTSALRTQVELRRQKNGGRLVIHFRNEDDLQNIYDALLGEDGR